MRLPGRSCQSESRSAVESSLRSREARIVAKVKEDASRHRLILHFSPSSTACRVHFIIPVPRKLDPMTAVVPLVAAVHEPVDAAELELARVVLSEANIPWNDHIDEIRVPLVHVGDSPFPDEGFVHLSIPAA